MFTLSLFDEVTRELLRINKDFFKNEKPITRTYEAYNIDSSSILITLNTTGISPEDIEVIIKNEGGGIQVLQVSAETTNKIIDKTYSYKNQLSVGSTRRQVESFQWEAKDGILYVFLKYKEPEKVKEISSKKGGLLETLEKRFEEKE